MTKTSVKPGDSETLVGANLPADRGYSGLGLLMQLIGCASLGLMLLVALMPMFTGPTTTAWPVFLFGALGAIRAIFHWRAGGALTYRDRHPTEPTRHYIIFSLVHTVLAVGVLRHFFAWPMLIIAGVLFLAWPAALYGLLFFRRRSLETLPVAEDRGFEGAAVLMTALGLVGAGFVVSQVLSFVAGHSLDEPTTLLTIGIALLLLLRAGLQFRAGWDGAHGLDAEPATDRIARYNSFAVLSAIATAAAALVFGITTQMGPYGLVMVMVAAWWLLMWPLALRRYFLERNFAVLLEGDDAPTFRRAPDAGLTALGWLLIAVGLAGAILSVGHALLYWTRPDLLSHWFEGVVPGLVHASWWAPLPFIAQVWAGVELARMGERRDRAVSVYVVAAVISAAFSFSGGASVMDHVAGVGSLLFALALPAATLILTRRDLTPDAIATWLPTHEAAHEE